MIRSESFMLQGHNWKMGEISSLFFLCFHSDLSFFLFFDKPWQMLPRGLFISVACSFSPLSFVVTLLPCPGISPQPSSSPSPFAIYFVVHRPVVKFEVLKFETCFMSLMALYLLYFVMVFEYNIEMCMQNLQIIKG